MLRSSIKQIAEKHALQISVQHAVLTVLGAIFGMEGKFFCSTAVVEETRYHYLKVREEWRTTHLQCKWCRDALITELIQFCSCNQSGAWGTQYDENDVVREPKDIQIQKRLAKRKGLGSFFILYRQDEQYQAWLQHKTSTSDARKRFLMEVERGIRTEFLRWNCSVSSVKGLKCR